MQVRMLRVEEKSRRYVKHLYELYTLGKNNISNFSYESKFDTDSKIKVLQAKGPIDVLLMILRMNIDFAR